MTENQRQQQLQRIYNNEIPKKTIKQFISNIPEYYIGIQQDPFIKLADWLRHTSPSQKNKNAKMIGNIIHKFKEFLPYSFIWTPEYKNDLVYILDIGLTTGIGNGQAILTEEDFEEIGDVLTRQDRTSVLMQCLYDLTARSHRIKNIINRGSLGEEEGIGDIIGKYTGYTEKFKFGGTRARPTYRKSRKSRSRRSRKSRSRSR